ncbi:ABC transporter permease [Streptomyces sp. NPDC047071]|uniref:ABC transporter permease n=1 Tax=Streptomyces sp. NPDC047071 TaxID=3154808 RepID=UPI0034550A35
MLRTAWRNVRAHTSRVALTALAVTVGVAFLTGILLFTATVSDTLTGAHRQTFAHTDVVIRPDDNSAATASGKRPASLSEADLRRVEGLPGAERVLAVASGSTALGCPDGLTRETGRGTCADTWPRGPATRTPGRSSIAETCQKGPGAFRCTVAGTQPVRAYGSCRGNRAGAVPVAVAELGSSLPSRGIDFRPPFGRAGSSGMGDSDPGLILSGPAAGNMR